MCELILNIANLIVNEYYNFIGKYVIKIIKTNMKLFE